MAAAATAEGQRRLEQLQKLGSPTARAAHGVDLVAYVSAAQPRTAALHRLKGQVAGGGGWAPRCAAMLSAHATPAQLDGMASEAEGCCDAAPSEVRELRARLVKVSAWELERA